MTTPKTKETGEPREFWINTVCYSNGDAIHDIQCKYLEGTDYLHVIEFSAYQTAIERANELESHNKELILHLDRKVKEMKKLADYKARTEHSVEKWRQMAEALTEELTHYDCIICATSKKHDEPKGEP